MIFSYKRVISCLGLCAAILSYNLFQVHAAQEPHKALYTADQAKSGGADYQKQCASCHGSQLEGVGQAPPLIGDEFLSNYQDQPMAVFFDKIRDTMPATAPGSLTRPQTANILAFILKSNKYPEGSSELPADKESLTKLQLQKP